VGIRAQRLAGSSRRRCWSWLTSRCSASSFNGASAARSFQSWIGTSDELVESWRELANKAAERAIAIGYWPDGQADAVAARDEHAVVAPGPVEDQAAVSLLAQFLAAVNERTRRRLSRLGALDVVSQQVLIEVVRELEQQLWMSRAQLPPGSSSHQGAREVRRERR
jgi:DNA-binding ferritin-like protein